MLIFIMSIQEEGSAMCDIIKMHLPIFCVPIPRVIVEMSIPDDLAFVVDTFHSHADAIVS